MRIDGEVGEKP